MISSNSPTWKSLAQRNLAFRNALQLLIQEGSMDKTMLINTLCIECKFELIRMESLGVIEFKEDQIQLVHDIESNVETLNQLRKVV